jgi:serine O-acetyltransferase
MTVQALVAAGLGVSLLPALALRAAQRPDVKLRPLKGNPARIIEADTDARREAAASKMGFSAYGVTQNDDPLSLAMRGLIDNASSQEHQIALLWQAVATLSEEHSAKSCVPDDAARDQVFQAEKLTQLVGK